ncbi:hypothetical protein HZ326_8215 [Fusarium oxysporum f. sp. albedinis]|nr:hypothetical protein HZ326_8215 [Fusarium oxysporum f. sp. albedinis]
MPASPSVNGQTLHPRFATPGTLTNRKGRKPQACSSMHTVILYTMSQPWSPKVETTPTALSTDVYIPAFPPNANDTLGR